LQGTQFNFCHKVGGGRQGGGGGGQHLGGGGQAGLSHIFNGFEIGGFFEKRLNFTPKKTTEK